MGVGGIKEKVIAAKRERVSTILMPRQNEADFRELKDYLREGITAHFVDHYDDVYGLVFDQGKVPTLPRPSLGQSMLTIESAVVEEATKEADGASDNSHVQGETIAPVVPTPTPASPGVAQMNRGRSSSTDR